MRDGIHVLTVCRGYVRTEFGANEVVGAVKKRVRPDSVRGISVERVARATLEGYLKRKREVIVPWTMHPVVKLYQMFPGLVEWGMARMAGGEESATRPCLVTYSIPPTSPPFWIPHS